MKGLMGVLGASSKNSTMTSGVETGAEDRPDTRQSIKEREENEEDEEVPDVIRKEEEDFGGDAEPREVFLSDGEMDADDEFFQVIRELEPNCQALKGCFVRFLTA